MCIKYVPKYLHKNLPYINFSGISREEFAGSQRESNIVRNFLKRKGYSDNMINSIMFPGKKVRKYTKKEISDSLLMHSLSPRLYDTMRKNNMTVAPLPCPKTLRLHISHFICAPGMQQEFFELLGHKLSTETLTYRQAVVIFDEMHVRECYEYDTRLKTIFGPNKKVQVVMIR